MHRPSDQDVNWMSPVQGKSPPVQVKEPYGNLDMVTCRLSSCNPECTKYQGSHGQGKVSEKLKKFKVREKSGNFELGQGNLKFLKKSGKSQGIL